VQNIILKTKRFTLRPLELKDFNNWQKLLRAMNKIQNNWDFKNVR